MKKYQKKMETRHNVVRALLCAIALFFVVGSFANVDHINTGSIVAIGTSLAIVPVLTDSEKALMEAMKKEVTSKFDELLNSSESVKQIKEVIGRLNEAKTTEDLVKLKSAMEDLGMKLKSLEERKKRPAKAKSFADHIMQGVSNFFEKGSLQALKTNSKGRLSIEIGRKAATTMTETSAVIPIGTNSIPFSLTEFEPGITRRVRRQPFITQLVNMSRTIMEFVAWAEQTGIDPGVAGMTAEGAAKTQGSFTVTENKAMAETITYYIKISKRMLDDLALIENEIRTELMEVLALKLDSQVLKGNGTSPQLKGILQYAQAFSAGSALAGAVTSATNYDALVAAILQVRAQGNTLNGEVYDIFEPSYVVLHPADAAIMGLTKDSLGRYLMPPFMSPDGKRIENMPIVENVGMTQGSYLVGDFSKSNVRIREDANIAIGYENDDFTKNLVTILGEMRAVHYVKSNHANAFVSDTFANTKTIIGTV